MDYYISKCANCGQIKDILCTINDEPCCEVIGVKVNQIFKFSDLIFDDPKEYLLTKMEKLKV